MLNIQVSQKSRTLMLNYRVEQNCLFIATKTTGAAVDRQRQFLTQNSNRDTRTIMSKRGLCRSYIRPKG